VPARTSFLLALVLAALLVAEAGAAPSWRLEQPPPPPGAPFKVPLGAPGDLKFFSPSRGLLAIEGNATIPRGLFSWNGQSWHQLATVCGGPGDTARIAWAGPREFWVVSEPSQPRFGNGTALCHFLDGQVVASYSTPEQSPDPYRQMFSAACNGPSDCWFGGGGGQDPTGARVGGFHLHWDGANLQTVYAPQGRAVSDIAFFGGRFWESTLVGPRPENTTDEPPLAELESPKPRLIHRIDGAAFSNDPFVVADRPGVPGDGTELLGLDAAGSELWAVGGGAASGPSAPAGGPVPRPPLAARLAGGTWQEVALDESLFASTERFADVAVVPGTASAWAAVQPFADRRSTTARAKVGLIQADGSVAVERLPAAGSGRGSAAKIACPAPTECWLATYGGWLFHWTDGAPLPLDTDPAFSGTITFRPNEAAAQAVGDRPPPDDSQLFAPPPATVEPPSPPAATRVRRLPPVLRNVRRRLRGLRLTISFRLVRRAYVGLTALRRGRVVARARPRFMRPGQRSVSVRLNRRRWPTQLRFVIREPGQGGGGGGSGDNNTVTT
jgi:hypothetical protein